MKRLRTIEWEAVAGLLAAIVALVLHFLHVTDTGLLRVITLVLVALLFLRELRDEGRWEALVDGTRHTTRLLEQILAATPEPAIDLIGPSRLQCATARFAERATARSSGSTPVTGCSPAGGRGRGHRRRRLRAADQSARRSSAASTLTTGHRAVCQHAGR